MNEHLIAGPQCLRLVGQFEKAPARWPQTPEGAALKAYLCPAGRATISFGCTVKPDGTPVEITDTITEAEVDAYLEANLITAENAVRKLVTIELSQYQFDALTAFCFNVGGHALATSTKLLPAVNANRIEDAAGEFGAFLYSTTTLNGAVYKQALFGLLRRRFAEACLFLGKDWTEATKPENIALPTRRIYQMEQRRWLDEILPGKTEFLTVYKIAQAYPLPDPDAPETAGEEPTSLASQPEESASTPAEPAPVSEPDAPTAQEEGEIPQVVITHNATREDPDPPPSPAGAFQRDPPIQPPPIVPEPLPPPQPAPVAIKPMSESRRFWGESLRRFGHIIQVIGITGPFGIGPAANQFGKMYGAVIADPVTFEIALSLIVVSTGFIAVHAGGWLRAWGEKHATHALGTAAEVKLAKAQG